MPESNEGCASDEHETDCTFDDSKTLVPAQHGAVRNEQHLGWARGIDGGVCLPDSLPRKARALRFPAGHVSLSNTDDERIAWPTIRIFSVQVTFDGGPAESDVLIQPANLLVKTDGGLWSGDVFEPVTAVSAIPRGNESSPGELKYFDSSIAPEARTLHWRLELAPNSVPIPLLIRGGVAKLPIHAEIVGWNGVDLAYEHETGWAGNRRLISLSEGRGKIEGLRYYADGDGEKAPRKYVVQASQGRLVAAASLDARTPKVEIALSEPAVVRVKLNGPKGKRINIDSICAFDTDAQTCSSVKSPGLCWASFSGGVEANIAPGPKRCLAVTYMLSGSDSLHVLIVRAPTKSGMTIIERTVRPVE